MKYVIEKNGSAVSPVSVWTPRLAKKCGLTGNLSAPKDLPYALTDGRKLRAVQVERAGKSEFQTVTDNLGSVVDDAWVITQAVTDKPIEQVREILVVRIKAEAARRIEEIAPLWKQVRGGERAIELIEIKAERAWTETEQAEADYLRGKRNEIAAIREKSGELEILPDAELIALNMSDDTNWERHD